MRPHLSRGLQSPMTRRITEELEASIFLCSVPNMLLHRSIPEEPG